MAILAVDTASDSCSVALSLEGECLSRHDYAPRQHHALLIPMIQSLLAEAELGASDLTAIAISNGPGSFTGVRLGLGVVQGIAFAADLPLIPISSLRLLAQTAAREHSVDDVIVIVDARMKEVYWGHYRPSDHGLMSPMTREQLLKPQDVLLPASQAWVGVGSGFGAYGDLILTNKQVTYPDQQANACDLIDLALPVLAAGQGVRASDVLPSYLRDADAWKKIKQ